MTKRIILLAEDYGKDIHFSGDENIYAAMMADFAKIFAQNSNNNILEVDSLQKMTPDMRNNINKFVSIYNNIIGEKLNRLNDIFKPINNNSFFFIIFDEEITNDILIKMEFSLSLLNEGKNLKTIESEWEIYKNKLDNIFSNLMNKYEINVYDCDITAKQSQKKRFFGEPDKVEKSCIFCGQSGKENFRKTAHIIPESLGNNKLFANDECDKCNQKFGTTIDQDLYEFFSFERVIKGAKGKGGRKKIRTKNGVLIEFNQTINTTTIFVPKESSETLSDELPIKIKIDREINFMNVYRCLVKIAIQIADRDLLPMLKDTIKWICDIENKGKEDGSRKNLPPILSMVDFQHSYYEYPIIAIYQRKNNDTSIPRIYIELRITMYIIVCIVPFVKEDKDFSIISNFETFMEINKHYNYFKYRWKKNHFNLDKRVENTLIIDFWE